MGLSAMCLFFWFRSVGTALGQTGFVGRVLAVAAAAHLAALMLFALDSPLSFGWGTFGAGVALNMLLYGVTAPFALILMNRYGIRTVSIAAMILLLAGSAVCLWPNPLGFNFACDLSQL